MTDYWFNGGPGYFHYGTHHTSHVFEAQIGYDFGPLAVNWYTNFAGADGVNKDGDRLTPLTYHSPPPSNWQAWTGRQK